MNMAFLLISLCMDDYCFPITRISINSIPVLFIHLCVHKNVIR